MYGIFTSDVGKYTIHGCDGDVVKKLCQEKFAVFFVKKLRKHFL